MNIVYTSVATTTAQAGPTNIATDDADASSLVMVDINALRPTPPPPPRTAIVPAVRIGAILVALGGVLLVAALFVPSWYAVGDLTSTPPRMNGQRGTSNNGFYLNRVMPDIRDQAAVGWASTRHEKRTIVVVVVAFMTEALALMGAVSIYLWRPFISFAGMLGAALPALAVSDLLNIANVVMRRINAPFGNFRNSNQITLADFRIVDPHPGLGMVILFVGAVVVVIGTLIALIGGTRGRVLAQMPA